MCQALSWVMWVQVSNRVWEIELEILPLIGHPAFMDVSRGLWLPKKHAFVTNVQMDGLSQL